MAQQKQVQEKQIEEAPKEQKKEWDRKCLVCGGKTMMENPEVYDIEVYECQNQKCRAQFTIQTFYDLKTGKFLREEFQGQTMEAVS